LKHGIENLRIAPGQIGFDFDGVIADIGEAFLRLACEKHNYCAIKVEEITDFHVETCTPIPESVVQAVFHDILTDSLGAGLNPLPGALDVIGDLASQAKVTIITARAIDAPVIDWLEHHLSRETCRKIDLIAMEDHDLKVQYIRQCKLRFFVDDRAETCAQVAAAELYPLLYKQPWNRSWTDFAVVNDWQHMSELLIK
jgi:hypothetical protein